MGESVEGNNDLGITKMRNVIKFGEQTVKGPSGRTEILLAAKVDPYFTTDRVSDLHHTSITLKRLLDPDRDAPYIKQYSDMIVSIKAQASGIKVTRDMPAKLKDNNGINLVK